MASERAAERLRLTISLFDLATGMLRQTLRRRSPTASEADLDRAVDDWMRRRRGAEHGDAPGLPVPWPRDGQ